MSQVPAEIGQIIEDLHHRFQNEQSTNATIHAEGRLHFTFQGKEQIRWLHRMIPQDSALDRDITGAVRGTRTANSSYYNPDNSAISRNSPYGNMLAEALPGVEMPNGIQLLDRALYAHNPADIQDIDITTLRGSFPRIASLLRYQQELTQALLEKQKLLDSQKTAQDDDSISEIQAKLDDTEQRILRIRQRIELFITRARLRSRPLLDPDQNKAKRLNLLAGPVIIDGGPGTGKTTTLIHRIQYLLDTHHLKQDKLCEIEWNAEDETLLRDEPGRMRFRFYSPNSTLQFYLREALQTERLDATSSSVTTWADHRKRLLRDLNLTGTTGRYQLPRTYVPLLRFGGQQVQALLAELEEYIVFDIQAWAERLEKNFAIGTFEWQQNAAVQQVVQQINALTTYATVDELLRPLQQLRERGAVLLKEHREAYNQARDNAVTMLLASARQDAGLFRQLALLAETSREDTDDPDAPQDAETYEEDESAPAGVEGDDRQLLLIRNMLRSFARAYALSKTLPDNVLKGRNSQIAALLESRLAKINYEAIATGTRFMQLFNRLLSGPETLTLQALPRIFNVFRREVLYGKRYANAFENDLTPKWSTDRTSAIHADEADILLLTLFQLARKFYRHLPRVFTDSQHAYLQRYRDEMRPVVGVDEASDFTPLQLATITLLAHPRYDCVTLCGDLMQRLEKQGLLQWEDYTSMFPLTQLASLKISYRQCQALLRLAAKLYEGQMQERLAYKVSRRIKMPFKLRPTYYRNADADERLEWLVNLLTGLSKALGGKHIPNLAVLVKDSATARELAKNLTNDDHMHQANLSAQACEGQLIGEADSIRVFPVSEIKGMEFDGIVFWDADELEAENSTLDLDRLMYVAISRASFYVAVTFAHDFPKALRKVKSSFTTDTWAKQMLDAVNDDEEEEEE